ncbi:UDP-N-acetylmuramate--L-alanine ligase [Candidatus Peregrinibacteria bacterium]|nr:UDP-N-acetylmuramate--L-alanine ligase [Candidatus Peregrinibacteria bacterium]
MKIYCSGIGGIGLSAYAALQESAGHAVSGSDRLSSIVTEDLIKQGIPVFCKQDGSHVPEDADLFVYSQAVPPDAPERLCAREQGIRSMSYFEALGELSKEYRTVIAVCGSHGKSSTTAMTGVMMADTGKNPTVIVGTRVPQFDGRNWRRGTKDFLLVEACEYRSSFLNFQPHIVLMTNGDWDHVDVFPSQKEYEEAYVRFLQQIPADGMLITHGSDPTCNRVGTEAGCHIVDADQKPKIALQVPGDHMKENAQLVLALARYFGIPDAQVERSLKNYRGCWRRMELKGYLQKAENRIPVIDDYAHHPAEIRATLRALKGAYSSRRLVCIFQPHMHNRTWTFYHEFCSAFGDADVLVLTDVYDARTHVEKERIDIQKFARDIGATYSGDLKATEKYVRSIAAGGDILVCMGAGDITNLALCISQEFSKESLPSPRG